MSFFDIIKALLPVILLVSLLYALLYYVKKSGFKMGKKENGLIKCSVVSTKMIMPKKYITVVKIKGKLLVLGVSEHSINMLKEFDDDTPPVQDVHNNSSAGQNFLQILKKNLIPK